MMNGKPAAVLLDLDGTLLDTAPDLIAAVNVLQAERGMPASPLEELRHLASWGAKGMLAGAMDLHPGDDDYEHHRVRFIDLYSANMTEHSAPFEGMREVFPRLADKGIVWGVVTNKYERLAVPLMEAMAFDPPPVCVVGGDSAGKPKPDPAPLYLACERAGLEPAQCIYVGDSDRDITAGRAAGMFTIAAAYGYISADDDIAAWKADAVVHSAAEMEAVINGLCDA
jgi:phosphoglycolate phosphatase